MPYHLRSCNCSQFVCPPPPTGLLGGTTNYLSFQERLQYMTCEEALTIDDVLLL